MEAPQGFRYDVTRKNILSAFNKLDTHEVYEKREWYVQKIIGICSVSRSGFA